ncbi:hypothetical protein HFV04_024505 [Pseudomonas sp. BIGb0427]|uniref:hypothetical protein n=1 Tax=unclassified Pseudomonas TaxID=196821 RepID=UPI0016ADB954|nr:MULTISPECIES: hypothetical protein [unclassified Pseudomonas]NLU59030.1 hypothetical protein [Pseudomonas sp. BIGb0427]QPG62646.1 hypothetical protein HFV04_024505 [Pseudomonas sp. BIGb0427]UVM64993.1 hypothetical protein LOY34_16795 [Pseudomonas sp. B21-009]
MLDLAQLPAFIRRYYPTLWSGFFLAVISLTCASIRAGETLFAGNPAEPGYIVAFIMLGSSTLGIGQFAVIRGYSSGNRAVVGLLLVCLVACVLTYPFAHDALLAVVSVIAPLLALLAYNSRRYREMSKTLSDIRRNHFKPVSGKR